MVWLELAARPVWRAAQVPVALRAVLAVLAAPLVALVAVCLTLESSVVLRAPMA